MIDPKKRGRPREFDPELVLDRAAEIFLQHGYSGASIEQLASSMQINKPSLYAAFGDKRALYLRVSERLTRTRAARYRAAFERGETLEQALRGLFNEAVEVSLGGGGAPGCLIASASTTEALQDEAIRDFTRAFFALSDKVIAAWVRAKAPAKSPAAQVLSPEGLARLSNGVVHDISLRARVGEPRAKLREIARDAAAALALAAMSQVR
jgi:TetR/AcrR family transcriptional regulator, copper-responsive repressor